MVDIIGEQQQEALALCERGIDLIENNNDKETAHKLFKQAYDFFPSNPKINSWLGYTYGTYLDKVALGLKHCKMATDTGEPDALFYRNLGKLYLLQKNKRSAIGAFAKGLQIEKTNSAILKEWSVLGFRRKPFFNFLPRDNFLNKTIGKITWKFSKHNKQR
ncbi:MAG: hypothetical protein KDK51_05625 [Deltaproteobacteria bacterium]|nr:hypothetical protein [Deltaproteobacteria bacterium]